jgi:hypothetical protein
MAFIRTALFDSVTAMRSFNDDVLLPLLPRTRRG